MGSNKAEQTINYYKADNTETLKESETKRRGIAEDSIGRIRLGGFLQGRRLLAGFAKMWQRLNGWLSVAVGVCGACFLSDYLGTVKGEGGRKQ